MRSMFEHNRINTTGNIFEGKEYVKHLPNKDEKGRYYDFSALSGLNITIEKRKTMPEL